LNIDPNHPAPSDSERLAHALVHPKDPVWRSSIALSVVAHVLILFAIPALLSRGCKDAFEIPGGGGGGGGGGGDGAQAKNPVVIKMAKKPPQQQTRKRKQFGRTNSAISFYIPNIDDSTIATDVAQITENTYQANQLDAGGFAGEGEGGFGSGKGSGGGFAGGSANGKFRFIRFQHDDPGWNDGMSADTRADMNFMDEFRRVTKMKTADAPESIPVSGLANFDKGKAPPYIYFTGTGGAINLPAGDVKLLRQYLLDGGMVIADAGSDAWGRAFRSFITKVLPERELLDISNDDVLFRQPFPFPNGAPPLWHHDGSRARGVKIDGRWAVFYFPGNLNDAWKTGHGTQPPAIVEQSMRLGINLIHYASVQYLEATRRFRK
jgi:hypothetical protein